MDSPKRHSWSRIFWNNVVIFGWLKTTKLFIVSIIATKSWRLLFVGNCQSNGYSVAHQGKFLYVFNHQRHFNASKSQTQTRDKTCMIGLKSSRSKKSSTRYVDKRAFLRRFCDVLTTLVKWVLENFFKNTFGWSPWLSFSE